MRKPCRFFGGPITGFIIPVEDTADAFMVHNTREALDAARASGIEATNAEPDGKTYIYARNGIAFVLESVWNE